MPFNLLEAAANLQRTDLARTSDFQVMIFGPAGAGQVLGDEFNLSFRTDSIEFPGKTITTSPYKLYGPVQDIGFEQIFTDISMTVMLSDTFEEKLFFERWHDFIIGPSRAMSNVAPGMFDIGYYHDYVGTVLITQFDRFGEPMYTAELVEAYPVSILNLPANWGDETISKLSVTLAYRYYITEDGFWDSPLSDVREPQL